MKKILLFLSCWVMMWSCTYSVTLVHTEGEATDVIDETATNSPPTSFTLPLSIPNAAQGIAL